MAQVYALKLDEELNEPLFHVLISKISLDKKERVEKFFRKEDAVRCLLADLLIRYILIKNFRLHSKDISFQYTAYGKPSLKSFDNIHFNVSHSGKWIVCVTDDQPVGIDIELIKPVDLEIAEHYFSAAEKQQLFSFPASKQTSFFYELWTLKESFIKQHGKGLSIPLDSFSVLPDGKDHILFMSEAEMQNTVFFKQYELDGHYKMAACSIRDSFDAIQRISRGDVIGFFETSC